MSALSAEHAPPSCNADFGSVVLLAVENAIITGGLVSRPLIVVGKIEAQARELLPHDFLGHSTGNLVIASLRHSFLFKPCYLLIEELVDPGVNVALHTRRKIAILLRQAADLIESTLRPNLRVAS